PGQQCNLTRRRNVTLTCSSSADPAPGLAWRLLLPSPSGGQQTCTGAGSQPRQPKTASPTVTSPDGAGRVAATGSSCTCCECVSSSRYFEFSPERISPFCCRVLTRGRGRRKGRRIGSRMK
uniref:Ig-like domain-containing protein n=1 Tax=Macrostomum lignano TaxID=282301 RepID=A0A1I8FRQ4_9PLAT